MTFKTRELTVDLVNATPTKEMSFYQGDENSVKLILNITNEGQELDLGQAKAVRITFNKSDGTTVFQEDCKPINALKGKYQIILKTQTLAAVGNVYAQVRIFIEDRKLDAEPFVFTVKQSYSGDTAVESKNEFTIIQRALEVGEQFKGVDFAPIIAAGALAQGALPKTGGTMTGNIDMDIAVGSKSKGVRWKDATGTLFGIESSTTGELILYDYKSAARIWQYDPVSKRFTVLAEGNLLKNTGGVMSGHIYFEKDKGLYFKNADTGAATTLYSDVNGMILRDLINGTNIWQYNYASKTFDVSAGVNTNLMKKTGDSMTGELLILAGPNKGITIRGAVNQMSQSVDANGDFYWYASNTKTPIKYNFETDTFTIHAVNTNLVKKGGDTMTGSLGFDVTNGGKAIRSTNGSSLRSGLQFEDWGVVGQDWENNRKFFEYLKGSDTFNVTSKNTNLVTKTKDGRATLTLSADATNWDTTVGSFADRRGNTVTVKMAVKRNAGSANNTVTTLPVDMRPTSVLTQYVTATDGTVVKVVIDSVGAINIGTDNKNIYLLATYVVD